MERQINSPRFSFAFAFVMIMLGTHRPQQQATLTKKIKISEIFFRFRFRNAIQRKSQILGFLFIFACNCFCEDGTIESRNVRENPPLKCNVESCVWFSPWILEWTSLWIYFAFLPGKQAGKNPHQNPQTNLRFSGELFEQNLLRGDLCPETDCMNHSDTIFLCNRCACGRKTNCWRISVCKCPFQKVLCGGT